MTKSGDLAMVSHGIAKKLYHGKELAIPATERGAPHFPI